MGINLLRNVVSGIARFRSSKSAGARHWHLTEGKRCRKDVGFCSVSAGASTRERFRGIIEGRARARSDGGTAPLARVAR